MAKVTISFIDGDDGEVTIYTESDPAIEKGALGTGAQHFALHVLRAIPVEIEKFKQSQCESKPPKKQRK